MTELDEIRKKIKAAKIRERRSQDPDYNQKCKDQSATIMKNKRACDKKYADHCKEQSAAILKNKRAEDKKYADHRKEQSAAIKKNKRVSKKEERAKKILNFATTVDEYREWKILDENGNISSDFFLDRDKNIS